jgi:hypothetical protein
MIYKILEYLIPIIIIASPFILIAMTVLGWLRSKRSALISLSACVTVLSILMTICMGWFYSYCISYMGQYDGPSAWYVFSTPVAAIQICITGGIAITIIYKRRKETKG